MNDLKQERVPKIFTRTQGAHIIAVAIAKSTLEWLTYIKIFNQKEAFTLAKMLDSPDHDNADLAIELIKTRLNGDSI